MGSVQVEFGNSVSGNIGRERVASHAAALVDDIPYSSRSTEEIYDLGLACR
jgi:hypothetical protein